MFFFLTRLPSLDITVITLMKTHIYKARMKGILKWVSAMVQTLKPEAAKEFHTARMKNQECAFEQKWCRLAVLAV